MRYLSEVAHFLATRQPPTLGPRKNNGMTLYACGYIQYASGAKKLPQTVRQTFQYDLRLSCCA
jgi:hypothetical protein